jgi:hypothetical protein
MPAAKRLKLEARLDTLVPFVKETDWDDPPEFDFPFLRSLLASVYILCFNCLQEQPQCGCVAFQHVTPEYRSFVKDQRTDKEKRHIGVQLNSGEAEKELRRCETWHARFRPPRTSNKPNYIPAGHESSYQSPEDVNMPPQYCIKGRLGRFRPIGQPLLGEAPAIGASPGGTTCAAHFPAPPHTMSSATWQLPRPTAPSRPTTTAERERHREAMMHRQLRELSRRQVQQHEDENWD